MQETLTSMTHYNYNNVTSSIFFIKKSEDLRGI